MTDISFQLKNEAINETTYRWFRFFWVIFFALMVINPGVNFGLGNTNAVERLVLLAAGIFYVTGKKVRLPETWLLILITLIIISCGALTSYFGFEWSRLIPTLVGFLTIFMFFIVRPRPREAQIMLVTLVFVPVFMVLINFIFVGLGMRSFWAVDHTGATRLGATVVTAHLAAAGMVGAVSAALLATKFDRRFYIFVAINFLITFLTVTRTPLAITTVMVSLILFVSLKTSLQRIFFILYGASGLVVFLILFGSNLITRIESGSKSGRESLWNVFLAWAERYPNFGIGFGHHSELVPDKLAQMRGTATAHSEFVRLWVELGHYGSYLFWSVFIFFLISLQLGLKVKDKFFLIISSILFLVYCSTDNGFYLVNGPFLILAVILGAYLKERDVVGHGKV